MKQKRINLAAAVAATPPAAPVEITFGELVAAFTARHFDLDLETRLRKWVSLLGPRPAWDVKTEEIVAGRDAMLAAGYAVASVNRDLSAIGQVYLYAIDRRMAPAGFVRPTLNIRRGAEPVRRVEVPDDTLARLRAGARAHQDRRFGLFVCMLLDSGARKSEIYGLRWDDLDTERGQAVIATSKNGLPRTLFFQPETCALIERQRPKAAGAGARLVFDSERRPGQAKNYRAAWVQLRADVGRADLRMHDTRHAAAARLLRSGTTLGVAAQVLGHDPAVLARRYGHLEADALRAAQQRAWGAAA